MQSLQASSLPPHPGSLRNQNQTCCLLVCLFLSGSSEGEKKKNKKRHLLIEQHLFFHVSCTLEWRGSTWEQHAPRQEEEQSLCCCSLVCVCVWWNLVPRFLGVSLLLLFFFSEQDLGMGITLCDLSAVSEFCVSAPRALSSPLHILSQEGRK